MERKASKPGMSSLNSDAGKSILIPVEGEAKHLSSVNTSSCDLLSKYMTQIINLPHLFPEFPVPKNELFQRFQVYYLGSEAVAKPVGKKSLLYM